jgi:hypothetical protein
VIGILITKMAEKKSSSEKVSLKKDIPIWYITARPTERGREEESDKDILHIFHHHKYEPTILTLMVLSTDPEKSRPFWMAKQVTLLS